jgi:Fe-S-cluster-containing dehydrogenase component
MQLGFVLDQSRCIGCHACTVACKSENDVPLGNFRTWVKYTENGMFPDVKRSFTVLRCNQCSDAPCVTICPVSALEKRIDGIVDVDHRVCIGCKACLQGCPYDALYLNTTTGTVQKCHFCVHRTERGLAPACAIVCPTEAIIPGDFHDPESRVSRMRDEGQLVGRKLEAKTYPNVLYKAAHRSGIDPLLTSAAGGFLWANSTPGIQLDADSFRALEDRATARTTYDVAHPPLWGNKVTGYLFTKSIAAGSFLALALLLTPWTLGGIVPAELRGGAPAVGLLFLLLTTALLVGDLKRIDRFYFILTRPNWSSWLAKGTYVLVLFGALLTAWLGLGLFLPDESYRGFVSSAPGLALLLITVIAAALAACYTAWLFGQAKGRVLWLRRGLWLHLILQAGIAGCGLWLVTLEVLGAPGGSLEILRNGLLASLAGHGLLSLLEGKLAPDGREKEYAETHRLISHGPFALSHWVLGVGVGIVVPTLLLLLGGSTPLAATAGFLALIGLLVEEHIFVRAGQALPIS